jgi:lysophospholipase L1-like esterase
MRLALLLVLLPLVGDAAPKREPAPPAKLDDPCVEPGCKRRALDHFRETVKAQRTKRDRPVRISYFGDSLIATDHIANGLRERLGQLLGAGGPGFVFASPPHPYNGHFAVQRFTGGSWNVHGVSATVPTDRMLGLGGSAEGSGTIRFAPNVAVSTVDVHYLEQPRGGEIEIVADGKSIESFSTGGDLKRPAFKKVALPSSSKRVELRAKSRVRLFGAALEAASGVVVDNLGVVNATAKGHAKYNAPEHLRAQLAHRGSDLVIVMFGTNEAEWLAPKGQGMAEHEHVMTDLLASVRAANPGASCLVVSPLDQLDWRKDGAPPRESVPAMVDAQHRAAKSQGCAFWDTYDWMGGKGASAQWFRRGLVIKDFQHPTSDGAARIAEALFAGLIAN